MLNSKKNKNVLEIKCCTQRKTNWKIGKKGKNKEKR